MALNTEVLRESFALVGERRPDFTRPFYDQLFRNHPETRALFTRNDLATQQKMLTEALVAVLDHLEDAPWLTRTLQGMGGQHVDYGVTDEMYDWVGHALLTTISEIAGGDWNDEVQTAWAEAYGAISTLMKQGAAAQRAVATALSDAAIRFTAA